MIRRCMDCGCTDLDPCVDLATSSTCRWISAEIDLCTACAVDEDLEPAPLSARPDDFNFDPRKDAP